MRKKYSLNCEHIVEKNSCPNCGQQNKHKRQPFHYLSLILLKSSPITMEFWATMENLVFK
ncbi:hypothetical protein [Epilithonimonas sp.]|uniref:hypothetical protein n=1 Tax=Epilithonimonas sp. TaxID=2894511 RepID=UPI002896AE76|nr:hypothetical protein [Epilithonimonas sp.]